MQCIALMALVGCEGELTRVGDLVLADVGPRDSGPRVDGGPGVDSGAMGTDTGPTGTDAGPMSTDTGPMGTDTGPMGTDSGPPPGECASGPLAAPITPCAPTPPASTGDPYQDCVNRINQFRWECQCLPPLMRWTEAEGCADQHAEYDANGAGAHGGFRDRICSPGGRAQNECPGWRSHEHVITGCLQAMWDEGPGEPFSAHGHYINMSNTAHTRVACGFYDAGGSMWSVQNFQ